MLTYKKTNNIKVKFNSCQVPIMKKQKKKNTDVCLYVYVENGDNAKTGTK